MKNSLSSKSLKSKSEDDIRQKIDGFSLNDINNKSENRYITTDQGVYSAPDDSYDNIKQSNNSKTQK